MYKLMIIIYLKLFYFSIYVIILMCYERKSIMELKNIKGTYDYLPKEQILRNEIINKLSNVF